MNKYDHFAFQVGNLDASIDFYVQKLGFQLDFQAVNPDEQEAYALLDYGNLRLELIQDLKQDQYEKPDLKPPYCPHLAIKSQDMQQTIQALTQKGVPILRGPLEIPGEETWLYLADPDNNVLEFIQWAHEK